MVVRVRRGKRGVGSTSMASCCLLHALIEVRSVDRDGLWS